MDNVWTGRRDGIGEAPCVFVGTVGSPGDADRVVDVVRVQTAQGVVLVVAVRVHVPPQILGKGHEQRNAHEEAEGSLHGFLRVYGRRRTRSTRTCGVVRVE
jgi:hypothetical protein